MQATEVITWSLGGLVAGLGVAIVASALFRDRSRGRPRCPRCWYDLTGATDGVCTECGHVPKGRSRFRTRRRWRWALGGLALVGAGLGFGWGTHAYRVGWVRAVPTAAYIAFLPRLDPNTTLAEVQRRMAIGELRPWESRLLVRRCVGVLESEVEPEVLAATIRLLADIEAKGREGPEWVPWASWPRVEEVESAGAVSALVALLDHEDAGVRTAAMGALGGLEFADDAMPALLVRLGDEDSQAAERALRVRALTAGLTVPFPFDWSLSPEDRAFLRAFASCGNELESAIPRLRAGLENESAQIRCVSVMVLAVAERHRPGAADGVLDLHDDRSARVREAVLSATLALPLDERAQAVLASAVDDVVTQSTALRVLEVRGEPAPACIDPVADLLPRKWGGPLAARAYVAIGGEADVAIDALLSTLAESARTSRQTGIARLRPILLHTLGHLGVESPRACEEIRPWLEDDDPTTRISAAFATAMLGGDVDHATTVMIGAVRDGAARGWYITALARAGRLSVPVMVPVLDDEDPAIRLRAVEALAWVGGPAAPALDRLRELRADPDPAVARTAEQAIRRTEYELEQAR